MTTAPFGARFRGGPTPGLCLLSPFVRVFTPGLRCAMAAGWSRGNFTIRGLSGMAGGVSCRVHAGIGGAGVAGGTTASLQTPVGGARLVGMHDNSFPSPAGCWDNTGCWRCQWWMPAGPAVRRAPFRHRQGGRVAPCKSVHGRIGPAGCRASVRTAVRADASVRNLIASRPCLTHNGHPCALSR